MTEETCEVTFRVSIPKHVRAAVVSVEFPVTLRDETGKVWVADRRDRWASDISEAGATSTRWVGGDVQGYAPSVWPFEEVIPHG